MITPEERDELIENFEVRGSAVFRVGEDEELFETLMDYIRKNNVTTYTDIDEEKGNIMIMKRPLGSLEIG